MLNASLLHKPPCRSMYSSRTYGCVAPLRATRRAARALGLEVGASACTCLQAARSSRAVAPPAPDTPHAPALLHPDLLTFTRLIVKLDEGHQAEPPRHK